MEKVKDEEEEREERRGHVDVTSTIPCAEYTPDRRFHPRIGRERRKRSAISLWSRGSAIVDGDLDETGKLEKNEGEEGTPCALF